MALEGVGFGTWIVWRALMVKTLTLKTFLVFLLCEVICVIVYIVDSEQYLYIVDDDE